MQIIGFAGIYYTLWSKENENKYFTDAYGKHHLTEVVEKFYYHKNISQDLEKVKELFPGVPIDDELRGQTRNFEKAGEDLTPEIIKFGKYCGYNIADIAEKDFSYLLWLLNNCYNPKTRQLIQELPKYIAHLEQLEKEKQERLNKYPLLESGLQELEFITNPNKSGYDSIIQEMATKRKDVLPETINWVAISEKDNGEESLGKHGHYILKSDCGLYSIVEWNREDNRGQYSSEGHTVKTIEEAKQISEFQKLVNEHQSQKAYDDTQFKELLNKNYAMVNLGENCNVLVFFDEIKYIGGLYPYYMAVINGKAQKIKGKKIKLNIEVLHVEKNEYSCLYVAKVIQ